MTFAQLLADRLNALPRLRSKLLKPIDASDCVQVLIVLGQLKEESIKKEFSSAESNVQADG